MSKLRTLFWFFRLAWPVYLAGFSTLALVVFLGNSGYYSWAYQTWLNTSAAFHQRLDFAGPFAALFGALVAGRLSAPSRVYALPTGARDKLTVAASQLLPLCLSIFIGYLLGMLPLVYLTFQSATYGRLDVAAAFVGPLGVVAFAVGGWLFGLVARTALLAPVAFAIAFLATVLGYRGDAFAGVLPVLYFLPPVGLREAPTLVLFRIAVLLLAVTTFVVAAARYLERRRFARQFPTPMSFLVWVPLLAMVILGVVQTPRLFIADGAAFTTCERRDGVDYCVHAANAPALQAMVDAAQPVLATFGTGSAPYRRVDDFSLIGYDAAQRRADTFYFDVAPDINPQTVIPNLAGALAGLDACYARPGLDTESPEYRNASSLAARLYQQEGTSSDGPFADVSREDLQRWISANRSDIRSCAVEAVDIPAA